MIELHGFITIRETYEVTDEENIDSVIAEIKKEMQKPEYPKLEIKTMNGEYYMDFSLFANHLAGDCKKILSFFERVGELAKGSYGLLYLMDDEDCNGNNNTFKVWRLARGRVNSFEDHLLSPFIPVVEDAWIQE